jgi:hypothetical protein
VALETPVADESVAGSVAGAAPGGSSDDETSAGPVVTLTAFACRPPSGEFRSLAWDAVSADPAVMITPTAAIIPTTWIQ